MESEGGVSEADAAFYSFSCVMLSLYMVPAVLYVGLRLAKQRKKAFQSKALTIHVALIAIAVYLMRVCLLNLQGVDTSGVFDPYEILHISDHASMRQIKKAYRQLAAELHPDKNLGDAAGAATRFSRVAKAYEALTDPVGKENFLKYGHPDGRQSMLLDFAILSSFSSTDGPGSAVIVLVYFGIIFFVLAALVYSLYKSQNRRDPTHVSKQTTTQFIAAMHDKMSTHEIIDLLLSSSEMTSSGGTQQEMKAQERSRSHDKMLKKMEAAKVLPKELLTKIKKHPNAIARENLIAFYQYVRRAKLAGMARPEWVDTRLRTILLELPYMLEIFAQMAVFQSLRRGYPAMTVLRTIELLSCVAQGSLVADTQALRDQAERMAPDQAVPEYQLQALTAVVADEERIRPRDWITLSGMMLRKHVAVGHEAPAASTFYDEVDGNSPFRQEHVWVIVSERTTQRLFAAWKVKSIDHQVPLHQVFQGPDVEGNYELVVHVICSSYLNSKATAMVKLHVEANVVG